MSGSYCEFIESGIDKFKKKVDSMTDEVVRDLIEKWKVMHVVDEDFLNENLTTVITYYADFYSDLSDSLESKKDELIKQVDASLHEHKKLENELKMEIKMSFSETEPLSVMLKKIDESLKEFREIREERVKQLNLLKTQELELCELLTDNPLDLNVVVPSDKELSTLRSHVIALQEEKSSRQNTYRELRRSIIEMMDWLESEPELLFEREVATKDENEFQLSVSNMEKIKQLDSRLTNEVCDAKSRKDLLLGKLEKLWKRINIDSEFQNQFLSQNDGIGKSVFNAISNELNRCEEIKLANIKPMILNARQEISSLWDKLTFSEEQRKQFEPYFLEMFSEDILELHELECSRLEKFYEDNKLIFELADKREVLWERMIQLDEAAQDKTRLFDNRGGKLLKEEKERKALETNLPKIDSQLRRALQAFMENHGKPFLWYGKDLLTLITDSWEERMQVKQSRILSRKNGQSDPKAPTPSLKRKNNAPTTPKAVSQAKSPKKTPASRTVQPRIHITQANNDMSTASIDSYSQFQEAIESVCSGTSPSRDPNGRVNDENVSPRIGSSSPVPVLRTNIPTVPLTPKATPRQLFKPKTPSRRTPLKRI